MHHLPLAILLGALHGLEPGHSTTMMAAFSFGLALTMVTVGAVAAWSVHHARRRFGGFDLWMRRAPYISCALLTLLALYMAWHG